MKCTRKHGTFSSTDRSRGEPEAGRLASSSWRATLAGAILCALAPLAGLRAEFTVGEMRDREEQLRHLEGIAGRHRLEGTSPQAALGLLVLRDEKPGQTARCFRSLAQAGEGDRVRHALECEHCRDLMQIVRSGSRSPTFEPAPVSIISRRMTERARDILDDGYGYVRTATDLGGNLSLASGLLEQALMDSPDNVDALQLYGVVNELSGDAGCAERSFKRAVNLAPDRSWGLNNVAVFFERHGLFHHAYAVLKFSLESSRDYRAARLLARLHRHADARELVPVREALRLMEWVVERHVDDRFEKIVEDRAYLRELRSEVSRLPGGDVRRGEPGDGTR